MEQAIGTTYGVFFVITVAVMGFAAYMTGQAMANTWKPAWHSVGYCILLGLADRFLTFALFEGELLSLSGYLIDTGSSGGARPSRLHDHHGTDVSELRGMPRDPVRPVPTQPTRGTRVGGCGRERRLQR